MAKKRESDQKSKTSETSKEISGLLKRIEAIDKAHQQKRIEYREFEEMIAHLEPVPRAEAWLKYVVKDMDNDGDCEALVYLVSRGLDCRDAISKLNSEWKQRESESISRSQGHPLFRPNIVDTSTMVLPNFWYAHRSQADAIDATMLRAAKWCGIRGFEAWWQRLAKDATEMVLTGGIDPETISGHFWLVNMSRSDYARALMPHALERCLEALEYKPVYRNAPWERYREFVTDGKRILRNSDSTYAMAALCLGRLMLGSKAQTTETLDYALASLQKAQHEEGYWPYWSADESGSVETTAVAVHALALARPDGWKRNVDQGAQWLYQQQHRGGYWQTDACPDPSYLTVLVLDALSLSSAGNGPTTFSTPKASVPNAEGQAPSPPSPIGRTDSDPYRFDVAMSFAGEVRGRAEGIATELSRVLGRDRVFYDNWFKPELARPNLDLYLQDLYLNQARLLVVFLSSDYDRKEWCGLEFRTVRQIIKQRDGDRIMYLRIDIGAVEGVLSIDGYIDIQYESDAQVASDILRRIQSEIDHG
jgi:hypothetical protein